MTISEVSLSLNSLVESYQAVVVGAVELRTLEARANDLDEAAGSLAPQAVAYALLLQSGLAQVSAEIVEKAGAVANTVVGAQRAFEPVDGSESRVDVSVFANAVDGSKKLANALSSYNREAWQQSKEKTLPRSDEQLVSALARLAPWQHLSRRLAELSPHLVRARDAATPTPANVDLLLKASDELAELRSEIAMTSSDGAVPKEVMGFLEALSTDGAPFALLSDTVRAWLERNDVSSSLRVVVTPT